MVVILLLSESELIHVVVIVNNSCVRSNVSLLMGVVAKNVSGFKYPIGDATVIIKNAIIATM